LKKLQRIVGASLFRFIYKTKKNRNTHGWARSLCVLRFTALFNPIFAATFPCGYISGTKKSFKCNFMENVSRDVLFCFFFFSVTKPPTPALPDASSSKCAACESRYRLQTTNITLESHRTLDFDHQRLAPPSLPSSSPLGYGVRAGVYSRDLPDIDAGRSDQVPRAQRGGMDLSRPGALYQCGA
jgi:hypothetical protein